MEYKLTSLKQNKQWLELTFRNDEYNSDIQLRIKIGGISSDILAKLFISLTQHASECDMYPLDLWLIDIHIALKRYRLIQGGVISP